MNFSSKLLVVCFVILLSVVVAYVVLELLLFKTDNLKKICKCKGLDSIRRRISNGSDVRPNELPWAASVMNRTRIEAVPLIENTTGIPDLQSDLIDITCGGTIITRKYVLTAYTCLQEDRHFEMYIGGVLKVVTTFMFLLAGQDHGLTRLLADERNHKYVRRFYSPPTMQMAKTEAEIQQNDIGLIELRSAFDFADQAGLYPACFKSVVKGQDHPLKKLHNKMITFGYGSYGGDLFNDDQMKDSKKFADQFVTSSSGLTNESSLPVFLGRTHSKLKMMFHDHVKCPVAHQKMICTFSKSQAMCKGDKGSGLLLSRPDGGQTKFYAVGVAISGGYDGNENAAKLIDCQPGTSLEISVNIYNHLEWIKSVVRGEDLCLMD